MKKLPEPDKLTVDDILVATTSRGTKMTPTLEKIYGDDVQIYKAAVKKWGEPDVIADALSLYMQVTKGKDAHDDVMTGYQVCQNAYRAHGRG